MNEAPGAINFTMFLTLFGERLQGTDPEDVIKNAFGKKPLHLFVSQEYGHSAICIVSKINWNAVI